MLTAICRNDNSPDARLHSLPPVPPRAPDARNFHSPSTAGWYSSRSFRPGPVHRRDGTPGRCLRPSRLIELTMTSTQIRQSFLDFFQSKQHTVVPSSSLLPDSPNLLFTNAGMNQFVPIFLGQVKCPYTPGRAADTQKCIVPAANTTTRRRRARHLPPHLLRDARQLSFGDYFKKEAIEWAWELVVGIWQFPPERLYATVYSPDKPKATPASSTRKPMITGRDCSPLPGSTPRSTSSLAARRIISG